MTGYDESVDNVLRVFAENATEAIERLDNAEYDDAFNRAVVSGVSEEDIGELLGMNADEQEERFGEEILPEDMRQAIQEFPQIRAMAMG